MATSGFIRIMHARAPSNAYWALARREATGRRTYGPMLTRKTLSLRQVLREETGGVLLGFSSDGNFLVYCISLDTCYEVQWRRVDFQDFYSWSEHGEAPEIVFKLRVDGGASAYGVCTPLEVWQSADDALVLAMTMESLGEEQESSRLSRVVVAPSPVFDGGGNAVAVTSLSFEFSQHALSQKLEKWQLLQLARGTKHVYHLLVNTGTTLHVLVFHAWKRRQKVAPTADREDDMPPRGLGISRFPQSTLQLPEISGTCGNLTESRRCLVLSPVYPIKFQNSTEHRQHGADLGGSFTAGVECICQHLFDVERFLGEFLETFKPLQHYNLVDYDLRLVRASMAEKTVFMIYVMALAPSSTESTRPGNQHLRVALFLSLELFTGAHHIIRALKVPGNGDLRHISQAVARRFRADLNGRLPQEPTTLAWDNEAVLREESLHELHNPRYPISISGT